MLLNGAGPAGAAVIDGVDVDGVDVDGADVDGVDVDGVDDDDVDGVDVDGVDVDGDELDGDEVELLVDSSSASVVATDVLELVLDEPEIEVVAALSSSSPSAAANPTAPTPKPIKPAANTAARFRSQRRPAPIEALVIKIEPPGRLLVLVGEGHDARKRSVGSGDRLGQGISSASWPLSTRHSMREPSLKSMRIRSVVLSWTSAVMPVAGSTETSLRSAPSQ